MNLLYNDSKLLQTTKNRLMKKHRKQASMLREGIRILMKIFPTRFAVLSMPTASHNFKFSLKQMFKLIYFSKLLYRSSTRCLHKTYPSSNDVSSRECIASLVPFFPVDVGAYKRSITAKDTVPINLT